MPQATSRLRYLIPYVNGCAVPDLTMLGKLPIVGRFPRVIEDSLIISSTIIYIYTVPA